MTTTAKQTEMKTGTVYYGDCLTHLTQWIQWNRGLKSLPPSLADLIYLDPPWNSNAKYNILFGKEKSADNGRTAQETAFTDIWQWGQEAEKRTNLICGDVYHDDYHNHPARKSLRGVREFLGESGMLAYLSYMAERLALLHIILKETGSIYLHCDPTASHYLKMIMDDIFGAKNFRNEILWCYNRARPGGKQFARCSDNIFFYSKSKEWTFNKDKMQVPLSAEALKVNQIVRKDGTVWKRKRDTKDMPNWWTDCNFPTGSKERLGYPTQKPLNLLKRIIEASSNEGDVVLDPFCGCGTAVVAAQMLKRQFIGIDISLFAVETVTCDRLMMDAGIAEEDIKIKGIPHELDAARFLAKEDPFAFETFAVEACHPGMVGNKVQRGDGGVDGKGMLLHPVKEKGEKKKVILAQVKAGKPKPGDVRDFATSIRDTKSAIAGVFITLEKNWWTDEMRAIAYRQGTFKHEHSVNEYPRLQHWHIGQFYYKTQHLRLPNLPELANPLSGKEMVIKQTGFLNRQYGK